VGQPGDVTSFGRYSREAMKLLFAARSELARLGGDALLPEHVLLAMLKPEAGSAHAVLQALKCPFETLRAEIEDRVRVPDKSPDPSDLPLSPGMVAVLEHAHAGPAQIGSRELLLSLVSEGTNAAATALQRHGITPETVKAA
jgi:ATP-dependent Clp protease ATP-binding subunit ClpC